MKNHITRLASIAEAGFTLIEMLLVMVIVSMIIVMGINYLQQRATAMRIDKTTLQMQQVLNAGLTYYVTNGTWPDNGSLSTTNDLSDAGYIPVNFKNPWGQAYLIRKTTSNFYVIARITASTASVATATATVIAGRLPLAYTAPLPFGDPPTAGTCSTTTCFVVASVNIPGQNLNNASAVNFAGLYHHGGCVPVPKCPVDKDGTTMTPQIMVVPVSVSGVNDPNTNNVYPISSFTAYATSNRGTQVPDDPLPPMCDNTTPATTSCKDNNNGTTADAYWRVCLQIITERGNVKDTNTATGTDAWGKYVTLLAITRCSINEEPAGSSFSVFTN